MTLVSSICTYLLVSTASLNPFSSSLLCLFPALQNDSAGSLARGVPVGQPVRGMTGEQRVGGECLGSLFLGDPTPVAQLSLGSAPDEVPLPLKAQRW